MSKESFSNFNEAGIEQTVPPDSFGPIKSAIERMMEADEPLEKIIEFIKQEIFERGQEVVANMLPTVSPTLPQEKMREMITEALDRAGADKTDVTFHLLKKKRELEELLPRAK